MKPAPKLDPATLRSVAKELRESAEYEKQRERTMARRRSYMLADESLTARLILERWATHFEGQAKTAGKK